jgi:hypothetical protein
MGDSAARSVNPAIQAGLAIRICRIRADAAAVHCTTNREDITLPRVAGGYLRIGDELRVPCFTPPIREYLCSRNSPQGKGRQLYFGRVGYVTQPRADKRNEYFIRAEVPESDLGVRFLHLPNDAVAITFTVSHRPTAAPPALRSTKSCARHRRPAQPICGSPIEYAASNWRPPRRHGPRRSAQNEPSTFWRIRTSDRAMTLSCRIPRPLLYSPMADSDSAWFQVIWALTEKPSSFATSCAICQISVNGSFAHRCAESNI